MIAVIIVDDDNEKIGRITSCLTSAGVGASEIDVAKCGAHARDKLERKKYDLMILDIALPFRENDDATRTGGIDLIDDITSRDTFLLPTQVVGLTQFKELEESHRDLFRDRLWALEQYSSSDLSWLNRLKARAEYLVQGENRQENRAYGCDLCVITALHTPELQAVLRLDWNWGAPKMLDDVTFYYPGHYRSFDKNCSVIAASATRMGMVASSILAMKLIREFRPRYLAMTGICAGYEGSCRYGDIILASPAWDWQTGKYVSGKFEIAPDQIDIAQSLISRAQLLGDQPDGLVRAYEEYSDTEKPDFLPRLKVGPMVSGSAVLADREMMAEIKRQHRKLLGVEMEVYGVYAASKDSPLPKPITFAMKSVSDLGDPAKADTFQPYAAAMSALALKTFMERFSKEFGCGT